VFLYLCHILVSCCCWACAFVYKVSCCCCACAFVYKVSCCSCSSARFLWIFVCISVTPISRKKHVNSLLGLNYGIILAFYCLLAFTGIFAFAEINDLYTLNFQPQPGEPWYMSIIHYFLSLFPVFTLSTNFPIIAITLRNNLKTLFLTEGQCTTNIYAITQPCVSSNFLEENQNRHFAVQTYVIDNIAEHFSQSILLCAITRFTQPIFQLFLCNHNFLRHHTTFCTQSNSNYLKFWYAITQCFAQLHDYTYCKFLYVITQRFVLNLKYCMQLRNLFRDLFVLYARVACFLQPRCAH
jgi:hypothetical protein